MYRDNTLVPREAVRLLALGILATRETTYAALAAEVRHFTSHMVGPSLDLVAPPIELLKVEGLVEGADGKGGAATDKLRITASGRTEFEHLLKSNLRPPVSDINRLILSLKMRFLHLLPEAERQVQIDMIAEMFERQLARLTSLRGQHTDTAGHLVGWLDHEIAQTQACIAWFENMRADNAG